MHDIEALHIVDCRSVGSVFLKKFAAYRKETGEVVLAGSLTLVDQLIGYYYRLPVNSNLRGTKI